MTMLATGLGKGVDEGPGETAGRGPQRLARCLVALTLTFCEYWLLNYCAFPLFDGVFIWTRELSAVVGGLVLVALALGSFWSVRPPSARLFTWGTLGAMVLGTAGVAGGVVTDSTILVATGAALVTIGGGLANVYVGLGCIGLPLRDVALVVGGAYVASYTLRGAFALVPVEANLVLFVALPVVAVACARRWAGPFVEGLGADESPAQMSVTAPSSFLPFGHQVFVVLVIFRIVYGYTLTFGEVGRVPTIVPWALALLGVLVVGMAAHARLLSRGSRPFPPDVLFRLSVFFSVAGFLFVLLTGEARDALASTALATGTGCFEILMYYALIAVGTRNPSGALPALAWGNAMASWGTIIGATLGRATNQADPALLGAIVITIALALVAYVVFVLPGFSFEKTIEGVEGVGPVAPRAVGGARADDSSPMASEAPSAPAVAMVPGTAALPTIAAPAAADPIEERCRCLAERGGLTERECEVLGLLAHGRNARFIQESLAISYSTTKTHVSHIYQKLGVHAHQELLDLVEDAAAGPEAQ